MGRVEAKCPCNETCHFLYIHRLAKFHFPNSKFDLTARAKLIIVEEDSNEKQSF